MPSALIVDDAPDIRFLIRTALGRDGLRTSEANSGSEALAVLQREPLPDVVILDVQMPDLDGWETLEAIRKDARTAHIPVILCTVRFSEDDARRGWSLGCDGYITKPFDVTKLRSDVSQVLSRTPDDRLAIRAERLTTPTAKELRR